jgi:hypothetical protein
VHTVQNQTFEGEILAIDDTIYSDCVMINCTLEYSGGPVAFERTQMRGCHYVFYGKARRTVHFLQGVGLLENRSDEWTEIPHLIQ